MILDLVLEWLATWGPAIVFGVTFLSCLALPVPSSIVMMTAGGFAASGDMTLTTVVTAALLGAVLGDNAGYWIARASGSRLDAWIAATPRRTSVFNRARRFMDRWGGSSVFLSCWLVAPLGPYMNYLSGMTRFRWWAFAVWGLAGEIVWVGLYVGLGYIFASQISTLATLLGNLSGVLVALVAVIVLGGWLWRVSKRTASTQ